MSERSRSKSRRSSSTKAGSDAISSWQWIVIILALLVIIAGVVIGIILLVQKRRRRGEPSPMDDPLIIARIKKNRDHWYKISKDPDFIALVETIMTINSNSSTGVGSRPLLLAFKNLDNYCNTNCPDIRVTLIYKDGIVFYDNVLSMDDIFYMKDGLPIPVNMATLGSPLKSHNTVPEMTNSIIVHQLDELDNSMDGMRLIDPIYPMLIREGFGFSERVSSSLGIPYSYVARSMITSIDPTTKFINGCTLRVSTPIVGSLTQKEFV